jgi:ferredoxin
MSLYSMAAVTEIRPRSQEVCATCNERSCVKGTANAWRCPWLLQPFKLDRNNYCGLCMECVKACPNENLTVNARPFCSDTAVRRRDEAWMAFIMIALVVAYSVTLLGPWGTPREWSNVTEVGDWGGFATHVTIVWLAALLVVPGVWYLAAVVARRWARSSDVSAGKIFTRYSYLLVPLGLLAWAAFSFPLIMVNYSHIVSSLSDPLGWGWDLFGTASHHWSPLLPEWIPVIQIPLLLFGLGIALSRGATIARELFPSRAAALRSLVPHALLCTAITIGLLRLYVG